MYHVWRGYFNNGVPQGCVLSLALFSFYTNEVQICESNLILLKYTDDMAMIGLTVRGEGDLERAYFKNGLLTIVNIFI